MSLSNVVAFITGAGQGLGRATAAHFAKKNAKVVLTDISELALRQVASEIGGSNSIPIPMDVTDEVEVSAALRKSKEIFGKIDVVVNCAGISSGMRTISSKGPHSLTEFERVLAVNTVGTFNVARLSAVVMSTNPPDKDRIRGVLINTSSIAAYEGQIGQVAYAASKGAVAAMTLPLARDLAKYGIRVMTIAPGYMSTPMLEKFAEPVRDNMVASTLLPKRLGRPRSLRI